MTSEFDPIRQTPLPDSFERTADWLRAAPPPRPSPARPLALAVALALAVGACSWPVASEAVVGYVIEATTAEPRALVRALDAAVAADARVSAEVEPRGETSAVRYVVLDAEAAQQAVGAARAEGVAARVSPLDADVRQPLGLAAARWVGITATPRLDDADLQAALDRAFADHPTLAPRVGRDDRGRRVVEIGEAFRLVLPPGSQIRRSGPVVSLTFPRGGPADSTGGLPDGALGDVSLADLLGEPVGTVDRRRVEGDDLRALFDSLGVPPDALDDLFDRRADSVRTRLIPIPDSLLTR